jgi:hypothetical protein
LSPLLYPCLDRSTGRNAGCTVEENLRGGFHSLRGQFATEMKHAPLKDLCYLGGWKSAATVINVYQQPDAEIMQAALNARRTVSR